MDTARRSSKEKSKIWHRDRQREAREAESRALFENWLDLREEEGRRCGCVWRREGG